MSLSHSKAGHNEGLVLWGLGPQWEELFLHRVQGCGRGCTFSNKDEDEDPQHPWSVCPCVLYVLLFKLHQIVKYRVFNLLNIQMS